MDNMYKLYISIGGGAYFCHRCGCKGSWYDFKNELSGGFIHETSSSSSSSAASASSNGNAAGISSRHPHPTPYDGNNNSSSSNNNIVPHLPMPPKKLNSVYIAKLFDPSNSPTVNPREHHALKYLMDVRGLKKSVLLKYGVGCAPYNFPTTINKQDGGNSSNHNNNNNANNNNNNNNNPTEENKKSTIGYVSSMCVTFPWMMRASEVAELEELRGSKFDWKENGDDHRDGTTTTASASATTMMTSKEGKHISEMTPLERHHFRKSRKNRTKGEVGTGTPLTVHATSEQEKKERDSDEADMEELLYGPYISRRIKVRSVEQKSWQRLDPPGGGFGFFGWHTVPHNASELIITEGEFDAMAVYQATGRPAVSLPNGCRSFPTELLVLLEKFDTIYLWMDNDGPGREGAEMFARKLGVERCLLVQPSRKRGWNGADTASSGGVSSSEDAAIEAGAAAPRPTPLPRKDANEALLMGWNLNELLDEAELPHEKILRLSDLRDQVSFCTAAYVYHLEIHFCLSRNILSLLYKSWSQVIHEVVNPEKYRGSKSNAYPLNRN
mgnify:CR=1 FL=1